MFVRTKHKIDKSHEFALVVVNNDATWVSGDGDRGGGGTGTAPCAPHRPRLLSALRVHLGPPRGLQLPLRPGDRRLQVLQYPTAAGPGRGPAPRGVSWGGPWVQTASLERKQGPSRPIARRWQQPPELTSLPKAGLTPDPPHSPDWCFPPTLVAPLPPWQLPGCRPGCRLWVRGVPGVGRGLCAGIGPYRGLQIWKDSSTSCE